MISKKMTLKQRLKLISATLLLIGVDFTAIFALRIGDGPWIWLGFASAGAIFFQLIPVSFAYMLKNWPTKWKHPDGKHEKRREMFILIITISTTIAFLIVLILFQAETNWIYTSVPFLTTVAAMVFAFMTFPKDCFFVKKYEEAKIKEEEANKKLFEAKEECNKFLRELLTSFNITSVTAYSDDKAIHQACVEQRLRLEQEQIREIHENYSDLLKSNYYEAIEVYISKCIARLLEIAQKQNIDQATLQELNNISIKDVLFDLSDWNTEKKIAKLTKGIKNKIPLDKL